MEKRKEDLHGGQLCACRRKVTGRLPELGLGGKETSEHECFRCCCR